MRDDCIHKEHEVGSLFIGSKRQSRELLNKISMQLDKILPKHMTSIQLKINLNFITCHKVGQ